MSVPSSSGVTGPPLVAHVLHRFDTGGLENGVVNLINHLPPQAFRHVVIALTEVTDFRHRLQRSDVDCIALHKPPGQGAKIYPEVWRLLRRLRPAIVHTRNLAALEMQPAAWAAGVPVRIHGEHGRDVEDLDGSSVKYQRLRRLYSPFVQRYVALSQDLAGYLTDRVGIGAHRIAQIYNGVDAQRFRVRLPAEAPPAAWPFAASHFVVGTVGRMQAVKHQTLLARAFVQAMTQAPDLQPRLRLALVGEGPLRATCQQILSDAGLLQLAWLPGDRRDVPELMRQLNAFVLPSLGEGISNTILEAMASGLPVLATAVGGNPELVTEGVTGHIVPSDDVPALAAALVGLARDPARTAAMGQAGRADVERRFSLHAMVGAYRQLYEQALAGPPA
jgi:sugar transferase (PEP-CTERM/EpsH1 system associated)